MHLPVTSATIRVKRERTDRTVSPGPNVVRVEKDPKKSIRRIYGRDTVVRVLEKHDVFSIRGEPSSSAVTSIVLSGRLFQCCRGREPTAAALRQYFIGGGGGGPYHATSARAPRLSVESPTPPRPVRISQAPPPRTGQSATERSATN